MKQSLVVLARTPEPGRGKSRLRAALGDSALADDVVGAMVADTLAWAGADTDAVGAPLVIAHTGDPRWFGALPAHVRLVPQPDGDLGSRIRAAIDAGFTALAADGSALPRAWKGPAVVVQIGTDSPSLPSPLLRRLMRATEGATRAALLPADDGGWVALATPRPLGPALGGVRWSTSSAAADTLSALDRAGFDPVTVSAWYDIDDLDGVRRLLADPEARARAPRTSAALARLTR